MAQSLRDPSKSLICFNRVKYVDADVEVDVDVEDNISVSDPSTITDNRDDQDRIPNRRLVGTFLAPSAARDEGKSLLKARQDSWSWDVSVDMVCCFSTMFANK